MILVKTLKVELSEEEENAIAVVMSILDNMWEQSEKYEMEELWEQYGSNEKDWACINNTLSNLLNGGKE
jgi:hypothetical protein